MVNIEKNFTYFARLNSQSESVSWDHPDMQLFAQDRHRHAFGCILYPTTYVSTSKFIYSLRQSPVWLNQAEIEELELFNPNVPAKVAQMKANLAGEGALELTQRLFPIRHLDQVLRHCEGRREHYLAQCSFKNWGRSSDNVNQLTSCWVDLDFYKLDDIKKRTSLASDMTAVEFIFRRCEEGIGERCFLPTQIVRSGRGLYIKWIFSHFLPGTAAPRWRRCMEKLVEIFADFGADPAAKDAARVLRVTGSVNSKSRSQTHILHTGKPILFDELATAVLPRPRANAIDRAATKTLAENAVKRFGLGKKVPFYRSNETTGQVKQINMNPHSWPALVAHEIKMLAEMRGSSMQGHIELAVFIRLNFLLMSGQIGSEEDFKKEIYEMGQLTHARQDQLLSKVKNVWTRYQAQEKNYRFKKRTVIERLNISEVELLKLPCLAKAVNSGARKPTVQTRIKLEKNQQDALRLEKSGMQLQQIAILLEVSQKTVKRWLVAAIRRADLASEKGSDLI